MKLEKFNRYRKALAITLLVPTALVALASCFLIPWMIETRNRLDNAGWEQQLLFAILVFGTLSFTLPGLVMLVTGRFPKFDRAAWLLALVSYTGFAIYVAQSRLIPLAMLFWACVGIFLAGIALIGFLGQEKPPPGSFLRSLLLPFIGLLSPGVVVGFVVWSGSEPATPNLPMTGDSVTISLVEPNRGDLIVKKTSTDAAAIGDMLVEFSQAQARQDHKCSSLGGITIRSGGAEYLLEVLPGHDEAKYEFRFGGGIFEMPREQYISCLVALGINPGDIRLDGHPGP